MRLLYQQNQALMMRSNPYVASNPYLSRKPEAAPLPQYEAVRALLPQPTWQGHESVIRCYDKAWELAFEHLRRPVQGSGFLSNYIDTAFNGFLFLWDSAFIPLFGRYAAGIFDFQKTLDNFYAHQHQDGFLCREICESEAGEQWSPFDPASTGPNILAWSEWENYCVTGDRRRLADVLAPLTAYHLWLKRNHTFPGGGYWATGLSCGMDNQPRVMPGDDPLFSHGHQIWADACIQQILSGKLLLKMQHETGASMDLSWLTQEIASLTALVNDRLWCETDAFYYDLWPDGRLNGVKSIGAYWALLAGIVPPERLAAFVAHLENPAEFARPNPIPSLAADAPDYQPDGGYWRGGVWSPTNYMVLRGLVQNGFGALGHEIACRHLQNVVSVFERENTLFENYAPEAPAPGAPARRDFVGWSGLSPIAILFEFVFGLHPQSESRCIRWDVRLPEPHGVAQYPFCGGHVTLFCRPGQGFPEITVKSDVPVTVEVHWQDEIRKFQRG
jgi:hypothetical protein